VASAGSLKVCASGSAFLTGCWPKAAPACATKAASSRTAATAWKSLFESETRIKIFRAERAENLRGGVGSFDVRRGRVVVRVK
jgi:hypothetical protein